MSKNGGKNPLHFGYCFKLLQGQFLKMVMPIYRWEKSQKLNLKKIAFPLQKIALKQFETNAEVRRISSAMSVYLSRGNACVAVLFLLGLSSTD